MRNIIALLIFLSFIRLSYAGVKTELIEEQYRSCTVRIIHDATPSSIKGTIIFRSNKEIKGLLHPCEINEAEVTASLSRGLAQYISQASLKPATSIMVGHISSYPWVRALWEAQSKKSDFMRLSYKEFNELVHSPVISAPFEKGLNQNGLTIFKASCEKVSFYKNGAPQDALCWFSIKST